MNKNAETLDIETEYLVDYNYTPKDPEDIGLGVYDVKLNSIEVKVGKTYFDILPHLDEKQKQYFIDKLTYE